MTAYATREHSTHSALVGFAGRVQSGEYEAGIHPKAVGKMRQLQQYKDALQETAVKHTAEEYAKMLDETDPFANQDSQATALEKYWSFVENRYDGEWSQYTADETTYSDAKQQLLGRFHKLQAKGWKLRWNMTHEKSEGFEGTYGRFEVIVGIFRQDALVQDTVQPLAPVAQTAPSADAIPDGTYTVMRGEQYRTFRVRTMHEDSKLAGKRIISYLSGPDNTNDYTGFGFVEGRQVNLWKKFRNSEGSVLLSFAAYLANDWKDAGETYALRSGNCWHCGKKLTVPASLHRGVGPTCAAKLGLV